MDSVAKANTDSAAQPAGYIPMIEVAWWSIPPEMSQEIYEHCKKGEDAVYTWDWGDARSGSWRPNDEETLINRYLIDFWAMEQRNIDNDRRRTVRIVWVCPADVTPKWTGQIPEGAE